MEIDRQRAHFSQSLHLKGGSCLTYSTPVDSGMSAGALSRPTPEQLTTQRDSASEQVQLSGHGPQPLPWSPVGEDTTASQQQQKSTKRRVESRPSVGTRAPCFRVDKVCPFRQGIAHSQLIASDGLRSLGVARKTIASVFTSFMCEKQQRANF